MKYTRTLFNQIKLSLFKGNILIVYGARQIGKSTLVKDLIAEISDKSLYLSCDDPKTRLLLENRSTEELLGLISGYKIIIIDEAQMISNIGITLKLIIDNIDDSVQIIATGSSSFELANKINEPLTGRNHKFFMYPLTISEIIETDGRITVEKNIDALLTYGLYPKVYTTTGESDKKQVLIDLATDYVYKDILSFDGIRSSETIKKLVQLLALRIGSEISYADLAKELGKSRDTVEKYVDVLEQAFIVFRHRPFYTNKEKEITKSHKIYFYDVGLRNALIGNFDPVSLRTDQGELFENFVIAEFYKLHAYTNSQTQMHFWRGSKNGGEIDLLETTLSNVIQNIWEIKNKKDYVKLPEGFKNIYGPHTLEVINKENLITKLVGMSDNWAEAK